MLKCKDCVYNNNCNIQDVGSVVGCAGHGYPKEKTEKVRRLIDANRLIADLREWKSEEYGIFLEEIELGYIIDAVEDQPTAYDLDKVVEELEKCINESFDKCDFGISRATYKKALRIVKRGGTDETNNQN